MEEEISLVELFDIIKKRVGMIINLTLIGLLVVAFYTFFVATPEYSSTTQLLVNRTQQTDAIQRSDIDTNVQLINTYKDIIKGPVILDEVREDLNLDSSHSGLSNQISISNEANSQVFSIRVTDINPYNAALIANTTASVFRENLDDIMNVDNVTVISQAEPNINPISPNHSLNLAIGIVLGAMIGVGMAFLLEFLDNTVKDEKFIVEEMGWTSLGRIAEMSAEELKADGRQALPQRAQSPSHVRSRV
ncbi:Tyrosine-protein kinase transmembrane modulator EpsC [Alkalibacterium sp. AK22]|uniref:YveK family protein n=1 Tax=Alkalibacterium sp. AK22 TaxID=1229520 RepID=UPI00045197BE|nr:Wzz/FepE/Etk N-terminal domain-containing protein [Alkalibacterium sp. AK22]EXJ23308.1 Tyrosine-protein kinase transmembrane modulator EpsC [Alkalibacterium sp. AK22]